MALEAINFPMGTNTMVITHTDKPRAKESTNGKMVIHILVTLCLVKNKVKVSGRN